MKMDPVAIAAGLLHDSVEDTSVTIEDIRNEFGEQVAHIVEGVTKISKIDFAPREERQAENVRKMVLAMVDDIRVVLIKLADRLHNMRTLKHLPGRCLSVRMLCRRSASLISTTRMSSTMASTILRTFSAWRSSRLARLILSIFVTPSTMWTTCSPNSRRTS